jgi:maltose/moltooligosaccharide transporter
LPYQPPDWWQDRAPNYDHGRYCHPDVGNAGHVCVPANTLVIQLTQLPVLGVVPVVGLVMMFAGIGWALININSLPMVVDMTNSTRIGTFTGLYYLFSGLAAIAGPNINGLIVQLTGEDYSKVMLIGPIFMLMALVSMFFVRRGEASEPVPLIPVEG